MRRVRWVRALGLTTPVAGSVAEKTFRVYLKRARVERARASSAVRILTLTPLALVFCSSELRHRQKVTVRCGSATRLRRYRADH